MPHAMPLETTTCNLLILQKFDPPDKKEKPWSACAIVRRTQAVEQKEKERKTPGICHEPVP